MFVAISGISASGKNTVIQKLIERRKNLKVLKKSSCTTRTPRNTDKDFETYNYLTKEEFEKGIKDGIFIEHELVHENYYGTLKSAFNKVIEDKDNDYMRDIDVKGTVNLKKYLQGKVKMVSIFLDAPDEILKDRLKKRGESEEQILKRLSRSDLERSYKNHYDLVIENIDLEKTLKTIIDFLDKERKNLK